MRDDASPPSNPATAGYLPWLLTDRGPAFAETFQLSPFDEALQFGRGLFETARTTEHRPWLWAAHLRRLTASAEALRFDLSDAQLPDAAAVETFVAGFDVGDVVVRLNVTAGAPSLRLPARWWVAARPLPPARDSVRLRTFGQRVSQDPFATLKTFHYGLRNLALREATADGDDDGLLVGVDGRVLEAGTANLFLRLSGSGRWLTPTAGRGVLPGTVRALVLDLAARGQAPWSITEEDLACERIADVDAAFVCNSGRGVEPVAAIDGRALQRPAEVEEFRTQVEAAILAQPRLHVA